MTEAALSLPGKRQIQESLTPRQWLLALPRLADADRRSQRRWLVLTICAVAFGLLGFFASLAIIAQVHTPLVFLGWLVVEIGLIAAAFLTERPGPNQLPAMIPLVGVLKEEMDPDAPLRLSLDMRGRTCKDKQVNLGHRAGRQAGSDFLDPFLSGSGRLADGSLLSFRLVDRTHVVSITKRSASGKRKTKVKTRVSTLIDVTLQVRTRDYVARSAPGAARLSDKAGGKRTAVRVRRVIKSKTPGALLDMQDFLGTMALCYQAVAPRRKEKRS
jgi:hypothetical protein